MTTPEPAQATRPGRGALACLVLFLPALLLFAYGALGHAGTPGLYMDAVNPDYIAVRVLNPAAEMPVWVLPGSLLFGRFPVLVQLYHGALPLYVGLPAYALFGTGVLGVRVANFVFGALVLVSAGTFLRAFGTGRAIMALALCALALDPGFVFSFRTQIYITLLPIALVLFSVALAERRRNDGTAWVALAAGFLASFSVYGYFIYAFLVPVATLHAAMRWRRAPRRGRLAAAYGAGLLLGGAPYALGLALVATAAGGPGGLLAFLHDTIGKLGVADASLPLLQRVAYFATMTEWSLSAVGPDAMMLRTTLPLTLPSVKLAALMALPAVALLAGALLPRRSAGLLTAAGLFVGSAALFLVFGNRLWLHHAAPLVPVFYLGLACSLALLVESLPRGKTALEVMAATLLLVLAAGNAVDLVATQAALARTGGIGTYSNAIESFAEDSARVAAPTRAFFPDWGVFMPFVMVTGGTIPVTTGFTPMQARGALCAGRDALLALIEAGSLAQLPAWVEAVGWGEPARIIYRQRDGTPVMTAIRWRAAAAHAPCG